jgi:hypothetical protein
MVVIRLSKAWKNKGTMVYKDTLSPSGEARTTALSLGMHSRLSAEGLLEPRSLSSLNRTSFLLNVANPPLRMAFRYTPTTMKKLETWYKEAGYLVRYERGSFQSGYCVLENKKVVVINKFFDLEARINALVDILAQIIPSLRETLPELAEDGEAWLAGREALEAKKTPS